MKNRFDKLTAALLAVMLLLTMLGVPALSEAEEADIEAAIVEEIEAQEDAPAVRPSYGYDSDDIDDDEEEDGSEIGVATIHKIQPIAFTGRLYASLICSDTVRYGDIVTLLATVKDANVDYSLKWQAKAPDAEDWDDVEGGEEYTFEVDEANAQLLYRAVLTVDVNGDEIYSDICQLPEILPEAVPLGPTTVTDAPVRIGPDGLTPIFATIPLGAEITVISIEGDWVKVEIDGEIGYVFRGDLEGLELEQPAAPEDDNDDDNNNEETPEITEKKVLIFSSRRTVMKPGEIVELTSLLEGFEDCEEIFYQWECDKGEGFEPVPGATSATYTFEASLQSLNWGWKLTVTYR